MLDHLKRQPWTVHRHAYTFPELHAAMHNCAVPADLPSMKKGFALRRICRKTTAMQSYANLMQCPTTINCVTAIFILAT